MFKSSLLEVSPTRSKPFAVSALLVLSLASTALAQTSGDEKVTEDGEYIYGE